MTEPMLGFARTIEGVINAEAASKEMKVRFIILWLRLNGADDHRTFHAGMDGTAVLVSALCGEGSAKCRSWNKIA